MHTLRQSPCAGKKSFLLLHPLPVQWREHSRAANAAWLSRTALLRHISTARQANVYATDEVLPLEKLLRPIQICLSAITVLLVDFKSSIWAVKPPQTHHHRQGLKLKRKTKKKSR